MTHEYYDPAKLTFIFSTPSPLIKKSSQIDESVKSHLDNNNNHATTDLDNNNNHATTQLDDDNIDSASRRNHNIQSPNHAYNSGEEEEKPVEPPIVTKMEDLLKFTSEFQKTIKSRRQKVADSFEESEASKSLVDIEDADYDEDERDEILQASANVPIRKNRLRNEDVLTTTPKSTETEEKVESRWNIFKYLTIDHGIYDSTFRS